MIFYYKCHHLYTIGESYIMHAAIGWFMLAEAQDTVYSVLNHLDCSLVACVHVKLSDFQIKADFSSDISSYCLLPWAFNGHKSFSWLFLTAWKWLMYSFLFYVSVNPYHLIELNNVYVFVYLFIYLFMYACMYVCTYTFILISPSWQCA